MRVLITTILFCVSLLAYSQQDMKAFINWTLAPNKYINVVDYMIDKQGINFDFPSITTKTAGRSFKVLVLKKRLLEYNMSLYSYDTNTTVKFKKTLLMHKPSFDVYRITVPYEYRNLRFVCKYDFKRCFRGNCHQVTGEDNSTDNFSVKPYAIKTTSRKTSNFKIIVDYGKSKYTARGANIDDYYQYIFVNGKGEVEFWKEPRELYRFCLDESWTAVDQDDTPPYDRAMPCATLILYPKNTSWAGIGKKVKRSVNLNTEKTFIHKLNW